MLTFSFSFNLFKLEREDKKKKSSSVISGEFFNLRSMLIFASEMGYSFLRVQITQVLFI